MCDNETNNIIIKEEILDNSDTNDQNRSDCDYQCEQYIIKSEQSDDHSDYELPKTKRKYKKRKSRYSIDCPQFSKAILAVKHIEEHIDHFEHIKALRSIKDDKLIGYRCKWFECEFANRYLTHVERHIKAKHTNDRRYKCEICDNRYTDESRLKMHVKDLHSNQLFRCDFADCGFVASYERRLKYHKFTHTKPYACDWPECAQRFSRNSFLNNHKKGVHLKLYRYRCDWPGCDKVYTDARNRNEHKAIHSGLKQFACIWPGCEFKANRRSSLRTHKKTHLKTTYHNMAAKKKYLSTLDRKFVCTWPECGKCFAKSWNLDKHLRVHSGERPFKCEYNECQRTFAEKGNMIKHLRTHNKPKNQK